MERADLVVRKTEGNKALNKIEIKPEKEVSIMDALVDINRNIYFYFLDKIQLVPHERANTYEVDFTKTLNAAMKDALKKEYIELYDIHKKFVARFITEALPRQIGFLLFQVGNWHAAQQMALLQFQLIFVCGYGPESLSIEKLRVDINNFATMSDVEFGEKLSEFNISPLAQSLYIDFKNNIVKAYQQYFKKAEEHLAYAQRVMPELTMKDFDIYRIQIAELIKENPQEKQSRSVLELMRLHALYPEYHHVILPAILKQCKPQPIIIGEEDVRLGNHIVKVPVIDEARMTAPIQLSVIARILEEEGLQPEYGNPPLLLTHSQANNAAKAKPTVEELGDNEGEEKGKERDEEIVLERKEEKPKTELISLQANGDQLIVSPPSEAQQRSFANTVQVFSSSDQIMQEFKDCPSAPQYEDKQEKVSAVAKVENILLKARTISDYNTAFNLMAPFINRHKNLITDMLFGNTNTDAWKKVMKQIREPATAALLGEVSRMRDPDDKIKRLKEACEMPLFNQHRNNHWYTGAFGDTHAVSLIKKEIANLEELKKRPKFYVQLSRSVE